MGLWTPPPAVVAMDEVVEVCEVRETLEAPSLQAPTALRSLLPSPTGGDPGLCTLGFSSPMDLPGVPFDSSAEESANCIDGLVHHPGFTYEAVDGDASVDNVEKSAGIPISACAVNSAYFDELVTTEVTQSASAALKSSAETLDQVMVSTSTPSSVTGSGDEKKLLRKKKDAQVEQVRIPPLKEVQEMLTSQKAAVYSQLEDLERLLDVQYKLTGQNPLFYELGSSVLGHRAAKKPGEPLAPDSVRFLREIFAVKDTVTKKEARDLSVQLASTRSQVKEFLLGQQSRVKRFIQVSTDGAGRVDANAKEYPVSQFYPTNTSGMTNLSTSDSVERLLESMRTESTFTGQSNIVQFILQADYVPGLRLFLDKGGLRFLSKWLNLAAVEEQTSLVRLILKALVHLPMQHANSTHVSPLVSTIRKLQFYFATDVGSRARSLLAKWSKLFQQRSGGGKAGKADAGTVGTQEVVKQSSLNQGPERKKIKTEASADNSKGETTKPQNKTILAQPNLKGLDMSERPSSSANLRRSLQTIEDPALASEASKKRLAEHGKEKRRVVLVEEVNATNRRVREADGRRSAAEKGSRPLSADEIKKAKMRERLLQGSSNSKDGQPSRLKESFPANRASATQSEPVAPSIQRPGPLQPPGFGHGNQQGAATSHFQPNHFQPAHALPNRQDVPQRPPVVQDGPQGSFNNHFQAAHFQPAHRQDPSPPAAFVRQHEPVRPPIEGSFARPAYDNPSRSLSGTGAGGSGHYQAEHSLPTRQDGMQRPSFQMQSQHSAPFYMLSPGLPAQAPPTFSVPRADNNEATVDVVEHKTAAVDPPSETDRTDMEVVAEDKIVEEVHGEHPLDSAPRDLIADLLKRIISWSVPPAAFIDAQWGVTEGDESKEKEIQSMRIKREAEESYADLDSVPQNPKDPWDEEPDYDDSLTPRVPLELDDGQQKEEPSIQAQAPPTVHVQTPVPGSSSVPSHDPELLQLLLQNPALVSQLASGQGLQALQGFKQDSHHSKFAQQPSSYMQGAQQFQRQDGYSGGSSSQYYGNAAYNAPATEAGRLQQWNGVEMFQGNQYKQGTYGGGGGGGSGYSNYIPSASSQQSRDYNAVGMGQGGGNWNRVSNNNLSFGHGNIVQGREMRPPHLPNSVLVDRFAQHLPQQPQPPPQQQQHQHHPHPHHQQQQQQQQQQWFSRRPGGW